MASEMPSVLPVRSTSQACGTNDSVVRKAPMKPKMSVT